MRRWGAGPGTGAGSSREASGPTGTLTADRTVSCAAASASEPLRPAGIVGRLGRHGLRRRVAPVFRLGTVRPAGQLPPTAHKDRPEDSGVDPTQFVNYRLHL